MTTRASARVASPDGPLVRPRTRARPPATRIAAVVLVGLAGGLMAVCVWLRGAAAGADAYAYWLATRTWLEGGNPYRPLAYAWPYAYAPWLLPAFVPWALLPWPVAEIAWRGSMLLGFAWSFTWAYGLRPIATAAAFALLAIPIGLTLESGNIGLFCALALWGAQLAGPRSAGFLWALATAVKWYPAAGLPLLARAARRWGLLFLSGAILLSLATWPWTLEQLRVVFALGVPRTTTIFAARVDHLAILWAAIPWLWLRVLPQIELRARRSARPPMAHRVARPGRVGRRVGPGARPIG